ncbi:MAG: hypothetical protein M3443_07695 [Actinomycetota bacterium]|nr:hypothetical protein [Actinomycetota bacterium]
MRLLAGCSAATIRADAIFRLGLSGGVGPARAALLDRSGVVRESAMAALRRAGFGPADDYRVLASVALPVPEALTGVAEVGLLVPWLSHPLPRAQDPWLRVLLDLRLDDPDLRLDAKADLANWVRYDSARTWSRPTGARAEARWTGCVSSRACGRLDGESHTRSRG